MLLEQPVQYAAMSDVGYRRQNNQDSYAVQLANAADDWRARGHLFMVADGMGGHAVGELASKIAVETVPHMLDKLRDLSAKAAMRTAIETANTEINKRGSQHAEFERMGTTGSCLRLGPSGAIIGHVGDSRVYRIRRGRIDQLTRDHSLVWELIAQRKISPKEAERVLPRNVITRSLGPDPVVDVDIEGPHWIWPGDTYLLCSDGLSSLVTDEEIGMVAGELPPGDACKLLIDLANLRGGLDNITVVIARVGNFDSSNSIAEESNTEIPQPEEPLYFASLLIFTLCLGLITIGGLIAVLTPQKLAGASLGGLGILGGIALVWRNRGTLFKPSMAPRLNNEESTVVWSPYRTASAKLTASFLAVLAKMEAELMHIAQEEHLISDWTEFADCDRRARVALAKGALKTSLADFGRAIHLLTAAVGDQRRRHPSRPNPLRPSGGTPPGGIATPVPPE